MIRRITTIALLVLGMVMVQQAAWADTSIVDPNDVLEAQGISPETLVQSCWNDPGPDADIQNVAYKTFKKDGHSYNLLLDVYVPSSFVPSIYPTAVLVHGGGWVGGCRRWLNFLSRQMADDGFVVFNINYRLACDPEKNPDVYLCGYNFAVPPTDVRDAISWVRTHGGIYGAITSKVAAVGTSAGGNLVETVGDTGVAGGSKPEVVAVASGIAEMGYMSPDENGDIFSSCEESDQPGLCDANKTQYMGFALGAIRDWCGDGGGDNWSPASPACNINPSNLPPPTFISNVTNELVALRSAEDFKFLLTRQPVEVDICTVGTGDPMDPISRYHGTELLQAGVTCNEHPTEDVYHRMMDFIDDHLP